MARTTQSSEQLSVKDRIQKWQEQGAGVIELRTSHSHSSLANTSNDDIEGFQRRPDRHGSLEKYSEQDEVLALPKSSKLPTEHPDKLRPSSGIQPTPSKRVISDGHWRAIRSPPKDQLPPKRNERRRKSARETTPVNDLVLQEQVAEQTDKGRRRPAKGRSSESRRLSLQRAAAEAHADTQGSTLQRDCQHETMNVRKTTEQGSFEPSKDQDAHQRASKSYTGLNPPDHGIVGPSQRRNTKSEKHGLLGQVFRDSRRTSIRNSLDIEPHPRVPSIEAWLELTADPFVDHDVEQELRRPPRSFAPSHEGNKVDIEGHDPNRIWETVNSESITPRHRRSRAIRRGKEESGSEVPPIRSACSTPTATGIGTLRENSTKSADGRLRASMSPSAPLQRRAARKSTSSPVRRRKGLANTAHPSPTMVLTSDTRPEAYPSHPERPVDNNSIHPIDCDSQISHADFLKHTSMAKDSNVAHKSPTEEETTKREKIPHTKEHSDLISMLSLRDKRGERKRSARKRQVIGSKEMNLSIEEVLNDFAAQEKKYASELLTLVDGVVPVLLSCVLSKSDSAVTIGLLTSSKDTLSPSDLTQPVIEMGVALGRLKSLHRRIPCHNATALFTWAHGAHKVYTEYIRSWRLEFQDVVVNLACQNEKTLGANADGRQAGLSKDANDDAVSPSDERVEVAFLLKRPLVRLKQLSGALQRLSALLPTHEAKQVSLRYQELVASARSRVEEERARLEDKAAASIDVSQTRSLRDLDPAPSTIVDRTRRVRARDNFNFTLHHSNGQCIDCRVELILREDISEAAGAGDLLICGLDQKSRWLLFPPFSIKELVARPGRDNQGLLLDIQGCEMNGKPWTEGLILNCEDDTTSSDWLQMLAESPIIGIEGAHIDTCRSLPSQGPEKQIEDLKTSQEALIADVYKSEELRPTATSSSEPPTEAIDHDVSADRQLEADLPTHDGQWASGGSSISEPRRFAHERQDQPFVDAKPPARMQHTSKEDIGLEETSTMLGLRRTKARRRWLRTSASHGSPRSPVSDSTGLKEASVCKESGNETLEERRPPPPRSTPRRLRQESNETLHRSRSYDNVHEESLSLDTRGLHVPTRQSSQHHSKRTTGERREMNGWSAPATSDLRPPSGYPSNHSRSHMGENHIRHNSAPPEVPCLSSLRDHDEWTPKAIRLPEVAVNQALSPLKQNIELSSASETQSDDDISSSDRDEIESVTDTSEGEELQFGDVASNLPLGYGPAPLSKHAFRPLPASKSGTSIQPSDSASQAPYKATPPQPQEAIKTIASIFSWSEQGSWISLHADECSIVLSPGLVEAFEMSAAHSAGLENSNVSHRLTAENTADDISHTTSQNGDVQGERPLVALELTPLVALHRGTALDISIRSSLTSNSRIKTANHVMFRSRSSKECEALYELMNHARIHNPTYIALQNARGPFAPGASYKESISRHPGSRASKSRTGWFGGLGRSSSYRASTKRANSLAPSENSIGTFTSAFSAFKRIGRGNGGVFNIALSTITSRQGVGSGANSIYTSSDHSSGSGFATPVAPGMVANMDGSLGLKDAKIRLYIRETASRWRDLGAAKLTILQSEGGALLMDRGALGQTLHARRVVIHGKTRGEVLLDAQLGESCFERVARTGIAVSVWEDVVGPNGEVGVVGAVGGVAGGRSKVYMIQVSPTQNPRSDSIDADDANR